MAKGGKIHYQVGEAKLLQRRLVKKDALLKKITIGSQNSLPNSAATYTYTSLGPR